MKPKGKKPVFKAGSVLRYKAYSGYGKCGLIAYKKAGKREIKFLRRRGWLEVMRGKLDAIIGHIAENEKLSRKEAIQVLRENSIRPTMVFLTKVGKYWRIYTLQMNLQHGLFFHLDVSKKKPNFQGADYSMTRQAIFERKKYAKKRTREKQA